MAEVQTSTSAGETTARFIEFVMMQAQNASLFLGLIPGPQGQETEVNLDLARMFIDQLAMIQEKTRGNLSTEEANVIRNALSNLQLAYVEVAQGGGERPAATPVPERSAPAAASSPAPENTAAAAPAPVPEAPPAEESKKRFTKSYGS